MLRSFGGYGAGRYSLSQTGTPRGVFPVLDRRFHDEGRRIVLQGRSNAECAAKVVFGSRGRSMLGASACDPAVHS